MKFIASVLSLALLSSTVSSAAFALSAPVEVQPAPEVTKAVMKLIAEKEEEIAVKMGELSEQRILIEGLKGEIAQKRKERNKAMIIGVPVLVLGLIGYFKANRIASYRKRLALGLGSVAVMAGPMIYFGMKNTSIEKLDKALEKAMLAIGELEKELTHKKTELAKLKATLVSN